MKRTTAIGTSDREIVPAALLRSRAGGRYLLPDDHYRLPQWRWELAGETAVDPRFGRMFRDVRDDSVERAANLVRALPPRPTWGDVRRKDPAAADALGLYAAVDDPRRWELEARFLARQDPAEIARVIPLGEEAVARYGEWFFDVRDRLDDPRFVETLLPPVPANLRDLPVEWVWKKTAYRWGPRTLDELLQGADGGAAAAAAPGAWLRVGAESGGYLQQWLLVEATPFLGKSSKVGGRVYGLIADRIADERTRGPELATVGPIPFASMFPDAGSEAEGAPGARNGV